MQELLLWQRTWEQNYNVSILHLAPFEVQKAALLQFVLDDLRLRIDFSTCASVAQLLTLLETDFKMRNPRMVLRHQWLKVKQQKYESFSDFMAREKATRKIADVGEINTEQLVAHVILAGCKDDELLKKMLEIKENELHARKIKEVADKFEVMRNTSLGLAKKEKEDKGGTVRQVRSKEGVSCYRCSKPGHFSSDCKTPRSSLKWTHCKTKQKHNRNNFCKNRQAEKGKKTVMRRKLQERLENPTRYPGGILLRPEMMKRKAKLAR